MQIDMNQLLRFYGELSIKLRLLEEQNIALVAELNQLKAVLGGSNGQMAGHLVADVHTIPD